MAMKVELRRVNDAVHFEGSNDDGNTVHIDGASKVGGEGLGFRPMQLALAALASCASMDVVPILEKQRQRLADMRVTATGKRADGTPSPFTEINLHFDFYGEVSRSAAERAVDLAVNSYCSVGATFSDEVSISWSLDIRSINDLGV
jgi:putative redox protein